MQLDGVTFCNYAIVKSLYDEINENQFVNHQPETWSAIFNKMQCIIEKEQQTRTNIQ